MNFKKGFATVLAGVIVALVATAVRAAVPGSDDSTNANPYALIISRNVFHLNPPPPPPAPVTNAPPPGTLKFTGIVKVTGEPMRALFVNIAKEATNTAYYTLADGERDRDLEVVKIHDDFEAAEVVHSGQRLTLWLTNSRPAYVGPTAPAAPPGVQPAVAPVNNPGSGVSVTGASPMPLPGTTVVSPPPTTIPTRSIRATPQVQPQTAEDSIQAMATDAARHQTEINAGLYPPPPPAPGGYTGNASDSGGPPALPTPPARRSSFGR